MLQLFFFSIILFSQSLLAKLPFYFPVNKSKLQILPQKFEYTLVNESTIQLGDVVVDAKNLNVTIEKTKTSTHLTFFWPSSLIKSGTLTLFNNYGKSLWSEEIDESKYETINEENSDQNDLTRKEKAQFKLRIDDVLFDDLSTLPFFKFCAKKKELNTRIEICSGDIYISNSNNEVSIQFRKSYTRQANVTINGKLVGDVGVIYLNNPKENIIFKAEALSGAHLEVETRLKSVFYKDVLLSSDRKTLKIVASGSYPVKVDKVNKISEDDWEITLPVEKPIFYIQGDGGIPMQQEFNIQGNLPQEDHRLYYSNNELNLTYSSSHRIKGSNPKKYTLLAKGEFSVLSENSDDSDFSWNLLKLKKNRLNIRYANLKNNSDDFVFSSLVYRGQPFELNTYIAKYSPFDMSVFQIDMKWWLDNLYSGIGVEYTTAATKPSNINKFTAVELSYIHRLYSGLNLHSSTPYLTLNFSTLVFGTETYNTFGASVGYLNQIKSSWLKTAADWSDLQLKYQFGQKGQSLDLNSHYNLTAHFFNQINIQNFFDVYLAYEKYTFSTDNDLNKPQVILGLGWKFLY